MTCARQRFAIPTIVEMLKLCPRERSCEMALVVQSDIMVYLFYTSQLAACLSAGDRSAQ